MTLTGGSAISGVLMADFMLVSPKIATDAGSGTGDAEVATAARDRSPRDAGAAHAEPQLHDAAGGAKAPAAARERRVRWSMDDGQGASGQPRASGTADGRQPGSVQPGRDAREQQQAARPPTGQQPSQATLDELARLRHRRVFVCMLR